jgi:hypothetical protein
VDEAAAVGVSESDLNAIALDGAEGIQQIVDVEADLDFLALVRHLDLVFRFLLLGIVSLEREQIRAYGEPDTAVLLVRENCGALQCLPQRFARTPGNDRRSASK